MFAVGGGGAGGCGIGIGGVGGNLPSLPGQAAARIQGGRILRTQSTKLPGKVQMPLGRAPLNVPVSVSTDENSRQRGFLGRLPMFRTPPVQGRLQGLGLGRLTRGIKKSLNVQSEQDKLIG